MAVEKNDVNINQLFSWSKEVGITDGSGKIITTVFIKLVGDADLNKARVFALRKSAELRDKLRNKESDEHIAFINSQGFQDKDAIIEAVVSLNIRSFTRDAFLEVRIPIPVEPDSDATLEDQEKWQKAVDEYPKKREEAIRKYIEKRATKLHKELEKNTEEELIKKYEQLMINEICEQESFKKFREMSAFFGLFKDKNFKNRLFNTFDEFDNISPDMKERLLREYTSLELDTETLKK